MDVDPTTEESDSKMEKTQVCRFCGKAFSRKSGLTRHIRLCHFRCFRADSAEGSLKCQEINCKSSFRYLDDFIGHLKLAHHKEMLKESYTFATQADFLIWKKEVEKATTSLYISRVAKKLKDGTTRTEYQCHRSGIYKPSGKNQRRLKTQGSQKIGCRCTSCIIVLEKNDRLSVTFHKTHYGHKTEVQHLRLTPEEKCLIAAKINEGVPFDAVLDVIRESVSGDMKRLHLSTNKDLHNIAAQYGVNNLIWKRRNDETSVLAWVEEMKQLAYGDPERALEMVQGAVNRDEEESVDDSVEMDTKEVSSSSTIFACGVCGKTFSNKSNVIKHAKKVHSLSFPSYWQNYACGVCSDFVAFTQLPALRTHHMASHGYVDEVKTLSFTSRTEFTKWKENEERQTKSLFVCKTGTSKLPNGKIEQSYLCQKSENSEQKDNTRTGQPCLSSMDLTENSQSKQIIVRYHCNHYGHDSDVAYQEDSLDEGLNQLSSEQRKHKFHQHRTPIKDVEALDSWVGKSLVQGDLSPVIYCKDRGVEDNREENDECLEDSDFLLVLSNPLQRNLLAQFGSNVVCIDCIDTGAPQEIALTAVVILDEFDEPFPVAFCLSNRIDIVVFKRFFECLEMQVGKIASSILVSNDMPALYTAWGQVMGECEHHQLCSWYTEKFWKNLMVNIPAVKKSKHMTVTRWLKTMMKMSDIEKFSEELETFLDKMSQDPDTRVFASEFTDQFAMRPEMWAHCYLGPKWTTISGNLEIMHRALRNSFNLGKDFGHIVRCITSLCKLVRDRNGTRLAKMVEGIGDTQDQEDPAGIVVEVLEDDCQWRLQNSWGESFQVLKVPQPSREEDSDKNYSCSCIENLAYSKCCQHITVVMQLQKNLEPSSPPPEKPVENVKSLASRMEEKMELLLSLLKEGQFSETFLKQMENQLDEWLNASTQSVDTPKPMLTESTNNSIAANSNKNVVMNNFTGGNGQNILLLICPPSMNVKVPIGRYKSPLEKTNSAGTISARI